MRVLKVLPRALLGVAALSIVACRTVRVAEGPPTPLIDGLTSFQTPDQAEQALPSELRPWSVVENVNREGPQGAPPFRKLIVRVGAFSHQGQSGELLLQFHNERLMETVFYPQKPEAYLASLKQAGFKFTGLQEPTTPVQPLQPSPYTKITISRDAKGRLYISWIDTRLSDEYHDWIAVYA